MANNTFRKNDFVTGDMVILRNGKAGTVMLDTPAGNIVRFHTDKDSFSYLDIRYNDDLTHTKHENMDIVKVYRIDTDIASNKIGDLVANPEKMTTYGTVVFDRDKIVSKPKPSDLITGDMVVFKNGKVATVYKGTPVGDIVRYHTSNNSFSYLYRYDDNLKHESKDGFDIVAVFRVQTDDTSTVGDYIGNPNKMLSTDNLYWCEGDFTAEYIYKGAVGRILHSEEASSDTRSESVDDAVNDTIEDICAAATTIIERGEDILSDDIIDTLTELIESIS